HSSNVSLYADHAGENLTVDAAMTINGNGHEIGDITVNTAGALTVGSALEANKLLVYAKPGASGQVLGAANLTATQAWTEQQLLPDESDLNPSTDWYCFTVPFNVSLANGVYTAAGEPMTSGVDYLVWTYDGNQRAATGNGWKRASGNLEAGKAYLIGFKDDETAKTFRFLAAGALAEPTSIDMVEYAGGSDANINWNAVGNPTLKHINVSGIEGVQLFQNASQTFQIYQTNEKSFVVGTAFFAQGTTDLDLAAASHDVLAPARRTEQASRMQACVEIYSNGRTWVDDRLYIAASEDAEETWQQGRDVPTLNSTSNRVALMHTPRYGMKLAAVDVPWAEQVDYDLVITAPAVGAYTLHAASMTDEASVWVTQDGVPFWDLSTGDYPLNLRRGTETTYGLRLIHVIRPIVTEIEEKLESKSEIKNHKLIIDGQLYISREGHLYNAIGQIIY
ncbi:MAG: hypothetical protein IJR74_04400, partial [Paludibacteraceae bacterium]|nr:hypothetical protein [Paludibacteraceae bacterium]